MFWPFSVHHPHPVMAIAALSGALFGGGAGCPTPLWAQLVPDATLPTPSIATDTVSGQRISGGTQAGSNLFHSFREFSVPSQTRVEFAVDPVDAISGVAINRIFSRVTGEQAATINGTLATPTGVDFYLLSPQGVVFGDRAQLDVGRDFVATTGAAIAFDDGRHFGLDAIDTPALLSVSVPLGLGLDSVGTGDIVNRSAVTNASGAIVGLQVGAGNAIQLVGRDLHFDGGSATSVDGAIALSATNSITVTNNGLVDVSGETGGRIDVTAPSISVLNGSKVLADALDDSFRNGLDTATDSTNRINGLTGAIAIDVDRLIVQNDALISTSTFGSHPGGTIDVTATTVEMTGTDVLENVLPPLFALGVVENPDQIGSGLFAMSLGAGNAGTLNVEASEVRLDFSAFMSTITTGAGNGGTLNLNADRLFLTNSEIFADTYSSGDGGVVNLTADFVRLDVGGGIFASTFDRGNGGLVNVNADRIEIDGTTADGQFVSGIGSNAFGSVPVLGGLVTINAREVVLTNGGGVGAGTFGPSRGGSIILRASESIKVQGVAQNGVDQSNITTQSRGTGEAGDIEITTRQLEVADGANISTSAFDAGPAGRLTVVATESIVVSGTTPDGKFPSALRSDAEVVSPPSGFFPPSRAEVVGAAGDTTIVTSELTVRHGAEIATNSTGVGEQAGNLSIQADRILLDTGGTIESETAAATEGNITIAASTIQLRRGGRISGNATGVATGGNLLLTTDTLVGLENSDITANAETGSGGQVVIEATGILGLAFRSQLTPRSDITATSDLGFQSSGTVELISPDIQLDRGLIDVPDTLVEVDKIAVDRCRLRDESRDDRFTINMRQGSPDSPDLALQAEITTVVPRELALEPIADRRFTTTPTTTPSPTSSSTPGVTSATRSMIAEASALERTVSGVHLTLDRPDASPPLPLARSACHYTTEHHPGGMTEYQTDHQAEAGGAP